MNLSAKLRPRVAAVIAVGAAFAVAGLLFASSGARTEEELKHYDSSKKDFWLHPPDDWFMGDETKEQKGTHVLNTLPPPTGFTDDEIKANLKNIKLPSGFKIELWASGLPQARQMAWGKDGTLYVGSFLATNVYAVTDDGGKRTVKTVLKGLKMPTGIAYRDGALYVADIDKIYKYDSPEGKLDNLPAPTVVYDDMPPYIPHGWKYLAVDKQGMLYVPFGPPCNECMAPTSTMQIRRVNPNNGTAEIIALGVRNSVGGDVDPRSGDYWFSENARDWISDDLPSDKLNHITRIGEHFGYPYCHQGDLPDPTYAMGHKCSEFTPPVVKLGPHMAPLGMKFYTGGQFPAEFKDAILLAEHGSWNRHKYNGGRIVAISVDPSGKHPKQQVLASGWIEGDRTFLGRPNDVINAPDGSILVADDWAGAIYRISYGK